MHGKDIVLENASIKFGDFTALHPTDLEIKAGEFFSILGPSGCGKTTILRMISGFLETTTGRVLIGGEEMTGVGPHQRPTALIFQNLALFPLMKVWQNVAFGLEMHDWPKGDRRRRAFELIDLVALSDQANKFPIDLSGGQRQRVAIARALAVEPAVLLLDEPLSALDLKLRQHMRAELRQIQRKTGVTFVYITHDQGEALTMSDRIAVIKEGVIQQVDTGDRLYANPATPFVASFVGESNVLRGRIDEVDDVFAVLSTPQGRFRGRNPDGLARDAKVMLFVRPENMRISTSEGGSENHFPAAFARRDLEGSFVNLFFKQNDDEFIVHLTNAGAVGFDATTNAVLSFAPEDGIVMAAGELADE